MDAVEARNRLHVGVWLLVCCLLVFAMVVLGGVTRLTGSGLSMVEWEPLMGIVPPLSEEAWRLLFEKYRLSPEYGLVNFDMDLDGFKGIFWLEYWHRVLGRLLGMAFLLPFLYFWIRRRIPAGWAGKLLFAFVLGGMQGLAGWLMVASGLVEDPHVSHVRLTIHLGLAFLIHAYMFWLALDLLLGGGAMAAEGAWRGLARFARWLLGLVSVTVLSGGLVAGLRAGQGFNTFPLMDGGFLPPDLLAMSPAWLNFLENVATVQWDHRLLAESVFFLTLLFWWRARGVELPGRVRVGVHLFFAMAWVQVALGISTLLLFVPMALASTHQAGAVVLFTLVLFLVHQLRTIRP